MAGAMPHISGGGVDLSHLVQRPAAGQAATGPGASTPQGGTQVVDVPSIVLDVADANFEQVTQLSQVVPIVFDIWSAQSEASKSLSPLLAQVTRDLAGRVLLARVDADANPGLAQAFQAQSIPTVVALIAGRPVPLFQGAVPEQQVREFFVQLVQLAEQNGVTGRVNAPDLADEGQAAAAPAEPQIPEAHVQAVEAAERGDYVTAIAEWEQVLLKAPADARAKAALVQVKLLHRLQGATADEIRTAAAERPTDLDAQMRVADLDVSGGHFEDAFLRLLDRFAESDGDDRVTIRERLLELFEVVGVSDPRVIAARSRLANLLY